MAEQFVRRGHRTLYRVCAVIGAFGTLFFVVGAALAGIGAFDDPQLVYVSSLLGALSMGAITVVCYAVTRSWITRFDVDDSGLVVHRPGHADSVPWDDVTHVSDTFLLDHVTITSADGRRARVSPAFPDAGRLVNLVLERFSLGPHVRPRRRLGWKMSDLLRGIALILFIAAFLLSPMNTHPVVWIPMTIGALLTIGSLIRSLKWGMEVTERSIRIRGLFGEREIPLDTIRSVEFRYERGSKQTVVTKVDGAEERLQVPSVSTIDVYLAVKAAWLAKRKTAQAE